jgi:hypothetical protein
MARIIENAAIGSASMPTLHAAADGDVGVTHHDLRHAPAIASEPDEQADTGVMTPARAPSCRPSPRRHRSA